LSLGPVGDNAPHTCRRRDERELERSESEAIVPEGGEGDRAARDQEGHCRAAGAALAAA
jgi:hypothetical protein